MLGGSPVYSGSQLRRMLYGVVDTQIHTAIFRILIKANITSPKYVVTLMKNLLCSSGYYLPDFPTQLRTPPNLSPQVNIAPTRTFCCGTTST